METTLTFKYFVGDTVWKAVLGIEDGKYVLKAVPFEIDRITINRKGNVHFHVDTKSPVGGSLTFE